MQFSLAAAAVRRAQLPLAALERANPALGPDFQTVAAVKPATGLQLDGCRLHCEQLALSRDAD